MLKSIFLLSFSLLLIRCSDSSTNYDEVELGKEFEIKVGDSAILNQQGIIIKFKSVNDDSRCPAGAVCFWEGNATITLELKNSIGDTISANLNTTLEPKEAEFSDLTILLKSLTPYPILDSVINPSDYTATLLVKN